MLYIKLNPSTLKNQLILCISRLRFLYIVIILVVHFDKVFFCTSYKLPKNLKFNKISVRFGWCLRIFLLKGQPVTNNVSSGIIVSNQTLVLQGVSRKRSGYYTCAAANIHGSSESNSLRLNIKCKLIIIIKNSPMWVLVSPTTDLENTLSHD